MIRGIGDPLVQAYARCYSIRVGITTCDRHEYMRESFNDYLNIYHTVSAICSLLKKLVIILII